MKKILVVLVTLILIGISSSAYAASRPINANPIEGLGYKSAEDAVSAYLKALSKADVETMISTFAVETFVENFDLEALIERLTSYSPALMQTLPSDNQFTFRLNIQRRQGDIARSIEWQYKAIFLRDIDFSAPIYGDEIKSDEGRRNFVRKLGDSAYLESLRELKVVGFITPNQLNDQYGSDRNQKNIAKQADMIGAQRIENVVARVQINNRMYLFCFEAVSYEGRWYLYNLGGNIAALLGINAYSYGVAFESDFR